MDEYRSVKESKQAETRFFAVGGEGGKSCNTPPHGSLVDVDISNFVEEGPALPVCIPGGFDTLEGSMSGHWDREAWEYLVEYLNEGQLISKEGDITKSTRPTPEGEFFQVCHHGEGPSSAFRRWVVVLEGGIRVGIVNRQRYSEHHLSVFYKIGSDVLMEHGLQECYDRVRSFLKSMGFQYQKESLSRVDGCVDLPGVDIAQFAPMASESIIGLTPNLSSKTYKTGARLETIEYGKGCKLRIYDKLAECQDKPYKLSIMVNRRWSGVIPEAATRVEWQVRREKLREWGIQTCADLIAKQSEFMDHLATWLQMTERDVDRKNKHQSRAVVHPLWLRVRELVADVYGRSEHILPRIRGGFTSIKQDVAQAVGSVARLLARTMTQEADECSVEFALRGMWQELLGALVERTGMKQTALQFSTATGPPIDYGEIPF